MRKLLALAMVTMLAPLCAGSPPTPHAPPLAGSGYTSIDALDLLMAGNVRFSSGMPEHRNSGTDRVHETATGQSPFAVVLTCADSRVPVELVFDRGVGDVFVVRVAGNTSGAFQAGSIEYAIEHLGSPLVVVMGHTSCGAVKAVASGGEAHGNIAAILAPIAPAVAEAREGSPDASPEDLTDLAVRCNVMRSISDLIACSPPIASMVAENRIRVVGAVYDIGTGRVEWLGRHPRQDEIVARAAMDHTHQLAAGEDGVGSSELHADEHADSHDDAQVRDAISIDQGKSGASKGTAEKGHGEKGASDKAHAKPTKSAGAKPAAAPAHGAKPASHANAEDEHH